MGAAIWVDSDIGRGSTFHFTARLGRERGTDAERRRKPTLALHEPPVLIVDDSRTNRRILVDLLTNWKMRPTAMERGADALQELEKAYSEGRAYALVLVDGQMPQMDGFMLARQIKSTPRFAALPIVMLTSAARPDDAVRCRTLGLQRHLTKPVKQSDLLDTILSIVGEGVPRPDKTVPAAGAPARRLRVLLAEDNAVNRQLVVRTLEKRGHSVVTAINGRQALEALERAGEHAFDLLLMDVQMPDIDGLAATATIRQRERASGTYVPIIAMTAHALKGDRERCLAAGMDDYVSKPLHPDDLVRAVERVAAAVPVESSFARNSPRPLVELAGTSWYPVSRALKLCSLPN
jgi:CheY-like chemotaxis protein